jgi:predicted GNAT superfamily acetyltransferase
LNYPPPQEGNILLVDGSFQPAVLAANGEVLYAEVPASLNNARVDVQAWRLALREALQAAFGRGYEAVDFTNVDERHWYVLRQL